MRTTTRRKSRVSRNLSRAALFAAMLFPALAPVAFQAPLAHAQNIGQRVVSGLVVGEDGKPVVGATVFLKNLKTKDIRSYSTTADGRFRFAQVNMVEDHELWAVATGKKSPVKTVSSWDARKEFETELKIK